MSRFLSFPRAFCLVAARGPADEVPAMNLMLVVADDQGWALKGPR